MKIIITSDIHEGITKDKDIQKFAKKANKYDLVLIAGDISTHKKGWLKVFNQFETQTAIVPGNHDCWTVPDNDSWIAYTKIIPEVCTETGIHLLDTQPLILNDEWAVIGSMGWYDYSFQDEKLSKQGHTFKEKRFRFTIWGDGTYINWDYSDSEFTDLQLEQIKNHLEMVKHIPNVIFISHFLPYQFLLETPEYYKAQIPSDSDRVPPKLLEDIRKVQSDDWRYFNAYMGSQRMGELLDEHENVKYVFCGHSHSKRYEEHKGKKIYKIGSDYGDIQWQVLEI